jgi:predicted MFS family arabinose efflux permease
VGRKPIMCVAAALNVVSLLLLITVTEYGWWMFAVRALFTASELAMFTAFLTYAVDTLPGARRTQGLAYFGLSGLIPIGAGALIAEVILDRLGFTGLFAIAAMCVSVSLLIVTTLPRRPTDEIGTLPRRSLLAALTQRDLVPVWVIAFAFAIGVNVLFTYMRTFVDLTGIGSVGLFFSIYAGSAVVVRIGAGSLPDRFGVRRVLGPMFLAVASAQLLLSTVSSVSGLVAAAALGGFGHGLVFPILSSETVRRARTAERGSALSLFTAVFDLAVIAAVPLIGGIIDVASYPAAFRTTALLMIIGLVAFYLLDPREVVAADVRQCGHG